jgi:hypothetical protein
MSTSVRFSPLLEQQMVNFCATKGITKTQLLTQAVAQYIAGDSAGSYAAANDAKQSEHSPLFLAFKNSGLIGSVCLGEPMHASADNARVRAVARERIAARNNFPLE